MTAPHSPNGPLRVGVGGPVGSGVSHPLRRARARAHRRRETGGCPHTAIREDASANLAATFSPELADLTLYVIDVSAGDKIPRKGGPGIMRSDPPRSR